MIYFVAALVGAGIGAPLFLEAVPNRRERGGAFGMRVAIGFTLFCVAVVVGFIAIVGANS